METNQILKDLEDAKKTISQLERRISQLENKTNRSKLPDVWIFDNSFLKRALGVYGHAFVGGLVVSIPIYCLVFLIAGASGF